MRRGVVLAGEQRRVSPERKNKAAALRRHDAGASMSSLGGVNVRTKLDMSVCVCCVRRVRVCVACVSRMAVVCSCVAAMACVCSVVFRCVGSSTGQQERCCGLDRCQLGEGAACCRSVGVAASSGRAWSSWATWSESRGLWRECQVWRIAPGASAYLYPRAPSCWGAGSISL